MRVWSEIWAERQCLLAPNQPGVLAVLRACIACLINYLLGRQCSESLAELTDELFDSGNSEWAPGCLVCVRVDSLGGPQPARASG